VLLGRITVLSSHACVSERNVQSQEEEEQQELFLNFQCTLLCIDSLVKYEPCSAAVELKGLLQHVKGAVPLRLT
jgi:hypothetical protein